MKYLMNHEIPTLQFTILYVARIPPNVQGTIDYTYIYKVVDELIHNISAQCLTFGSSTTSTCLW